MSRARKSERHRAKRKAKQQAARRQASLSPIKRLADARGEPECWMSEDFELNGQMQIFVYKQGGGLSGVACFLIDRGVVGLKDAWTRMAIDRSEFSEMLAVAERRGIAMRRTSIDEARRWIAGAARWAHDNGMRLPREWHKPAWLIGGAGDWLTADVSPFVKEFAGHPEDLRQRIIAEPFDTYIRRSDLQFIFNTAAPYMDQGTGHYRNNPAVDEIDELAFDDADDSEELPNELPEEEVRQLLEYVKLPAATLALETSNWLTSRGDEPSTGLYEAWRSIILARRLAVAALPDADEEDRTDFILELIKSLSSRIVDEHRAEHQRAVELILSHLQADPNLMKKAVLQQKCG